MRPLSLARPLLLCAALAMCAACSKPKTTPLATAQLFFDQIHRGEMKSAFENSTFSFQTQQDLKFFTERTREYGLGEATIELSPLASEPKTEKFKVEITKKSGLKYTLLLTLALEDRAWRVYSLRSPRNPQTGISEDRFSVVGRPATINIAAGKKTPSDEEVRRLVNASMTLFSDAVVTESFSEFYTFASAAWQKELTEQKLENAFHAFIEKKVDMTGLIQHQPIFDHPPEIGTDGLLGVAGYYPTKPFEVHFALRYIYELPEWKLLGLNCYLRNLDEPPKSSP